MARQFASNDREKWENALKAAKVTASGASGSARSGGAYLRGAQGGKGIAPNKAAGSKGGIRRQGSKRG